MARIRTRLCALAALALLVCLPAFAQFNEPSARLAREIAAMTGPGTVTLALRNISSLTAEQAAVVRRDVEKALGAAGVRVVGDNAGAAEISLTLSENAPGYVWVAEVRQAGDTRVAMVMVARSTPAEPMPSGPAVVIRKTPLWSQTAPILDVALLAGAERHMVVLDPGNISLYKMSGGAWRLEQQLPPPQPAAWPRDPRGRLLAGRDHLFDAYLPGMACRSSATPPLSLSCVPGDDPWPVGGGQTALFGAARNFFTGVVTPGIGRVTSVPAFYSAAALPRRQYTLWAFARTDGSIHLMDGVNDVSVRPVRDWGSDLTAVSSSCGTGTQLLVTAAGDSETPDRVRAVEIADREAAEVSAPVDMPGPVTALWTSADGRSATAVARNLKTSHYDAFELAITCGQ